MKAKYKYIVASLVAIAIMILIPFMFWCGGMEFARGEAAGFCVFLTTIFSIAGFGITLGASEWEE